MTLVPEPRNGSYTAWPGPSRLLKKAAFQASRRDRDVVEAA
jgi:hypothetical protein